MNVIEISHLKKYFGDVKAVDDISFCVEEAEFFAFLGVNGAGKSTTISVLCGKEPPTDGRVLIGGEPIGKERGEVKRTLGVVFQESMLDGSLTLLDNLRYRAALYGIFGKEYEERLQKISALLDLAPILKRRVSKLSGGQRRRGDIARALVHRPRILILDEPTTGLDPQTRKGIWEAVSRLRSEQNVTVFLTTHYMEEAADADRIVIIDGGKILADDTPLRLKEKYTGDFITLYHVREEDVRKLAMPYEKVGEKFRIEVKSSAAARELITAHPELFCDFELTKGKMDDVFLAVTGKRIGGENA